MEFLECKTRFDVTRFFCCITILFCSSVHNLPPVGRSSLHLGDFLCSFFYYLGTCAYPYSYSYTIFLSNLNLDSLTWDLETYIITNHIFSHFHYYRNTAVHGLYLGWLLSCQVSLCEFYNTVVCIEAVVYSTVVCKVTQRILGYIQFGYKKYICRLSSLRQDDGLQSTFFV